MPSHASPLLAPLAGASARTAAVTAAALGAVGALALDARVAHGQTTLPGIVVSGGSLSGQTAPNPPKATPAPSPSPQSASAAPPSVVTAPSGPSPTTTAVDGTVPAPASADLGLTGDVGSGPPGIPTERIGSAVTVVTGAELRASQVRHAGDAIRSLPGVHVSKSGGGAGITQVRMRGAEANHTLVLVDGIEANATNGGEFDFSDIAVADIERIEVIRGGHSGIYGSKAIGGVINIVTRGGRGPIRAEGSAEAGGLGTQGYTARVAGGTDRLWLALSTQHRSSNGFDIAPNGSERDGWTQSSVAFRSGARLLPGLTLDTTVRKSWRNIDTDPEGFNPVTGLSEAVDGADKFRSEVLLGGVTLKWDLFGGAFTQVVRANHNRTDNVNTTAFGVARNLSEASRFGYLATYRFATPALLGAKHAVSGLVENEQDAFTPTAAFTDGRRRERARMAYVGEWRAEFLDRFFLATSVRHDDNDKFADFTTWRTSLSVPIRELGIRPHASVGTSVALPGMFEQFGTVLGQFVGNPNLKPEESFGWDAGIELTIDRSTRTLLDVTYFNATLKNELAADFSGWPVYSMRNLAGESTREGVEIAVRSNVLPWLYLGASYTYLEAREPDGTQEIRRPKHAAKAELTARFDDGRGTFNVAAIYNGRMTDNNFGTFPATVVTLDDYVLVNAALSYRLDPRIELYVRGENLLNQSYQEISGYATQGLVAYAGVRIRLEDPSTAHWRQ